MYTCTVEYTCLKDNHIQLGQGGGRVKKIYFDKKNPCAKFITSCTLIGRVIWIPVLDWQFLCDVHCVSSFTSRCTSGLVLIILYMVFCTRDKNSVCIFSRLCLASMGSSPRIMHGSRLLTAYNGSQPLTEIKTWTFLCLGKNVPTGGNY